MMTAERYHEWKKENRVRLAKYQREYYAKHREAIRVRQKNKRDSSQNKPGLRTMDYKRMLVSVLYEYLGTSCGICGGQMEKSDASIDHIKPRRMGGTDDATNLRLVHRRCNHTALRGTKTWRGKPVGLLN